MTPTEHHIYGPVPSRRLGRSLGVDVVPFKVCSLDCIYCQLGRTTVKTLELKEYVPVAGILTELKRRIDQGLDADHVTIGGSGEPTLNSGLGRLIDGIKAITSIPVAVLTNGTLLYRPDVRAHCARADVVLPSLDAADERTFRRINRPHHDISIEKLIDGLCAFREEFAGRIWLEVFLVEGVNTDDGQIAQISTLVERIRPDKVHLNTAVRPTAERGLQRLDPDVLSGIAAKLGPVCEVIAEVPLLDRPPSARNSFEDVLSMLRRRPCSVEDICSGLGLQVADALSLVRRLRRNGIIRSERKEGITFYKAV